MLAAGIVVVNVPEIMILRASTQREMLDPHPQEVSRQVSSLFGLFDQPLEASYLPVTVIVAVVHLGDGDFVRRHFDGF